MLKQIGLVILIFYMPVIAQASSFSANSIIVSSGQKLFEYSSSGTLQQTISVPRPDDNFSELVRDITVGAGGDIHVYNGLFDPYLSTYNVYKNNWTHANEGSWDNTGNNAYGGIDFYNDKVFVTDSAGIPGVRVFDGANTISFAHNIEAHDLTIGLDGYLYVVGENLLGTAVTVKYDSDTYEQLGFTMPGLPVSTLAVDSSGTIFGTAGSSIQKMNFDGTVLDTVQFQLGVEELFPGVFVNQYCGGRDIDMSSTGAIVVGCSNGEVVMTDITLSDFTFFETGKSSMFVSFSDESLSAIPVPATAWLFLSGLLTIVGYLRNNRGQATFFEE